jgi:myo-inositol-hexaphosphate 3-phosphohydrolase
VLSTADETDGIEAASRGLGQRFPRGMVVVMNSDGRNFLYYRAEQFFEAAGLTLR